MTCEILRYRISDAPFGEQRRCIKCLTHDWQGYEGQMGMSEDAPICPAGRREAFERGPLAAAVLETKGMKGSSWEDYLRQVSNQSEQEMSQLERLSVDVVLVKHEVLQLGARLDRIMTALMRLEERR